MLSISHASIVGVKPFACSTCGKMFTRQAGLRVHEQMTTGERPVVPVERCSHNRTIAKLVELIHTRVTRPITSVDDIMHSVSK